MNHLLTPKIQKYLPFRSINEAVSAIQRKDATDTSVQVLTNVIDRQRFVRSLASVKLPVGIVVVTPKN